MTAPDPRLDEIQARLSADESKTVHDAAFGDILRTGWCTYYFGADSNWHNARTGDVIADLDALEDERLAEDEVSEWLTPQAPGDVAFLLAELRKAHEALDSIHALTLDPEHYDSRGPSNGYVSVDDIRAAVAAAKGDGE